MAFEPVHMVWDIYDGPRSGLASFEGSPYYFKCLFDDAQGGYSDAFQLWPIDQEFQTLATEQWQIYRAWERQFHSGAVMLETHPGNRGQSARYDELDDEIKRRLGSFGAPACEATVNFRARENQPELPYGCLLELEAEWSPLSA